MKKLGYIDSTLYLIGKVALAAVCAAALLYFCTGISAIRFHFPCIFEARTGIPCPGCGGTRSLRALAEGKFLKFIYLYPPLIYIMIVYVIFMIKCFCRRNYQLLERIPGNRQKRVKLHFISKKPYKDGRVLIHIYISVALILIQWVVKVVAMFAYHYYWFNDAIEKW